VSGHGFIAYAIGFFMKDEPVQFVFTEEQLEVLWKSITRQLREVGKNHPGRRKLIERFGKVIARAVIVPEREFKLPARTGKELPEEAEYFAMQRWLRKHVEK
jgi:hypothetical protein